MENNNPLISVSWINIKAGHVACLHKHSLISSPSLLLYKNMSTLLMTHGPSTPLLLQEDPIGSGQNDQRCHLCFNLLSVLYTFWSPTFWYVFGLKKKMWRMETAVGMDICCLLTTAAESDYPLPEGCTMPTATLVNYLPCAPIVDIFSVGLVSMGVLAQVECQREEWKLEMELFWLRVMYCEGFGIAVGKKEVEVGQRK